ncbi:hypothetical protein [Salinicola sp. RZ23]|uniref:hypothetical protein n=1 Tax=Salinicola sp. RZ23 TaxID=1949087 RepID=UPI001300B784|nr:hypothetical protein [Salinicola sp. RZ23]
MYTADAGRRRHVNSCNHGPLRRQPDRVDVSLHGSERGSHQCYRRLSSSGDLALFFGETLRRVKLHKTTLFLFVIAKNRLMTRLSQVLDQQINRKNGDFLKKFKSLFLKHFLGKNKN